MKILIIDDEEELLYLLDAMLTSAGYEVVSARNGVDALEKLNAETVDLIISDILMPKMDGIQLCRECKRSDRLRDIPFVFYTGTYTEKKDEEFARRLGATRFLVKPATPETFLEMVRDVLDETKGGRLAAHRALVEDEPVFLKQYNERLIKKLEDKVIQLTDTKLFLECEIAERKKAEEALRKSEKRLRDVTSSLGEGIYVLDARGHIKFMNPEAERLLGWTMEELNGHPHDTIHNRKADGSPLPLEECLMHNVIKTGKRFSSADEAFIRKDGTAFPVSVISSPIIENGNIVASVTAFRDISVRRKIEKQLEESEKLHRTLFECAGDAIYILDAEGENAGRIVSANRTAAEMHGYTPDEICALTIKDLDTPEYANMIPGRIRRILDGEWLKEGADHRKKDGSTFPVEICAGLVEVNNHKYILAIDRDITERKRAEQTMQASLREKELLLREIHHRVKNNLQIISSLLNIQSRSVKDEHSLELFKESRSRVMAIANLHEKLYRSKNLSKVDLNDYVRSISAELMSSYGVKPGAITITRQIQDVLFDIDTAIPCGLIINELLTNSIKYAFPDGRRGEVHIELLRDGNNDFTLVVSDNGIGLPAGFDANTSETLGLRLVSKLVLQLRGSMMIAGSKGTRFEIIFSEKSSSESRFRPMINESEE